LRRFRAWIIGGVVLAVITVVILLLVGGKKSPGPAPSASGTGAQAAVTNDTIAFSSKRDGNFEVYEMKDDGSGQHDITNQSSADDDFPSLSPDFKQVAFASNRDGNFEI